MIYDKALTDGELLADYGKYKPMNDLAVTKSINSPSGLLDLTTSTQILAKFNLIASDVQDLSISRLAMLIEYFKSPWSTDITIRDAVTKEVYFNSIHNSNVIGWQSTSTPQSTSELIKIVLDKNINLKANSTKEIEIVGTSWHDIYLTSKYRIHIGHFYAH